MSTARSLIVSVRQRIAASGVAPGRISRAAGLSDKTLRDYRRDDWNPTMATVAALEAALERIETTDEGRTS